ncbi:PDDEXK nuclease domain-containing protein [Chitinophaga sancti]
MARQYHISTGGKHFRLDKTFYHCMLKCFVLID